MGALIAVVIDEHAVTMAAYVDRSAARSCVATACKGFTLAVKSAAVPPRIVHIEDSAFHTGAFA